MLEHCFFFLFDLTHFFYFYFLDQFFFLLYYTSKLPKLTKAVGRRQVSHTCLNDPWCLSIDGITPSHQLPMEETMKEEVMEEMLIFVESTLSCCIISSENARERRKAIQLSMTWRIYPPLQRLEQFGLVFLHVVFAAGAYGDLCPQGRLGRLADLCLHYSKQYITIWAIGMPH